ncbi:MAG: hypothetical protein ACREMY_22525, partial [bacterium]
PRVVAHLQGEVDRPDASIEALAERWSIPQGIKTGADAFTKRIKQRLELEFPEASRQFDSLKPEVGDPIMELPAGTEHEAPWSTYPEALARSMEPGAILYGAVDAQAYTSLVWLFHGDRPSAEILAALEPWKPVLANRFDVLSNPAMDWWETVRPRDREQFCGPKVIALYRTDRGRFAVDEDGSWQPSIKATLVTPLNDGLSVAYLGGLLNSELLDLWYSIRGKAPRDVWRNYEPKRMKEIPYRHVDLSIKIDKKRLGEVKVALKKGDATRVGAVAGGIVADLRACGSAGLSVGEPVAVEAAMALEAIARALADNRRALLLYRDRFPALTRQVKDPWSTESVDPTPRAFVEALPKKKRVSVRVDPDLAATIETDGVLN